MGGWHSLNSLTKYIEAREKRLGNPNLAQLQRNQLAEQIDAARKAIEEWRTLSALDLTIKGLELSTYTSWAGTVLKLAKPQFEHRELKRKEQVYHVTSFDGEVALRLKPLEAQRDNYLEALKWFVHKE